MVDASKMHQFCRGFAVGVCVVVRQLPRGGTRANRPSSQGFVGSQGREKGERVVFLGGCVRGRAVNVSECFFAQDLFVVLLGMTRCYVF